MNIGERIGDYEIVEILGAGGMGEVYKVRNVISNRIEAMKVLLPNLGGDPGLAGRFLREIQVQATLDHPNIARLHTAHMSPEQIRGAQPDPRSDLYSLGITLYEMVTGRRPFEGTSDYSIMAAHLQQAPIAPIEVVPGVPQEMNDIILMAIAKDPAQRFQS